MKGYLTGEVGSEIDIHNATLIDRRIIGVEWSAYDKILFTVTIQVTCREGDTKLVHRSLSEKFCYDLSACPAFIDGNTSTQRHVRAVSINGSHCEIFLAVRVNISQIDK